MSDVVVIGVPIDFGAGRRGVDMGPSAIRYAELCERIEALGHTLRDSGNLAVPLAEQCARPEPGEKLRYLQPLIEINRALAQRVSEVIAAGAFPLILGGDHSIAIGSISGLARGRQLGVIWIDAHADFNTPETTPSGNIHGMTVAVLTGRGHPALVNVFGNGPALREQNIAMVGVRPIDPEERLALRASGIHVFTMHDVDRRGLATVMEEAIARVSDHTDGLHVSLDLDALDPSAAPGVGTPVLGGLSYREAHLAMEMASEAKRLISMDVVEVNPILDRSNRTAELAVELVTSALGRRIF